MTTLTQPIRATSLARAGKTISTGILLAGRNLAHVRQIPEKLIDVTLQPLMFVLLFAYVFGGVIEVSDGNYREYLLGGIFVQTLAFGIAGPGSSIATDLTAGIVDRLRAMPVPRSAFLLGHLLSSMLTAVLSLTVMALAGLVVGWTIHTDLAHAVAGFGLLLFFAFAMLWIGMLIGTLVRSPDAIMGITFCFLFPLTFLSNVFVPADGLPKVLRVVAEYNPMSAVVAACRTLFGNPTALPDGAAWPLQHPVLAATIWCTLMTLIAAPLAMRCFRARTAG